MAKSETKACSRPVGPHNVLGTSAVGQRAFDSVELQRLLIPLVVPDLPRVAEQFAKTNEEVFRLIPVFTTRGAK